MAEGVSPIVEKSAIFSMSFSDFLWLSHKSSHGL